MCPAVILPNEEVAARLCAMVGLLHQVPGRYSVPGDTAIVWLP
jgi:hypothetical protein